MVNFSRQWIGDEEHVIAVIHRGSAWKVFGIVCIYSEIVRFFQAVSEFHAVVDRL